MVVKGVAFCVFLIVLTSLAGCNGVPRPCPQFLPVAVQLDNPSTTYDYKGSVNAKEGKVNVISKHSTNDLPPLLTDLLLPDAEGKPVADAVKIKTSTKIEEETPHLLQISNLSNENPAVTKGPISQKPKKRRRSRPKEPKKIILSRNSSWALKTINDKPAEEVLMTDKASAARDLKDATESALVAVKRLEDLYH